MKLFVLTLGLVIVAAFSVGCGSAEDEETTADEAVEVDVDTKPSDVMPTTAGKRSDIKDAHDR